MIIKSCSFSWGAGYKKHGGNNKEKILLTINAFKKFCLKADEIHDYYIGIEEIINEQTDELQNQLLTIESKNKTLIKLNKHTILMEKMIH